MDRGHRLGQQETVANTKWGEGPEEVDGVRWERGRHRLGLGMLGKGWMGTGSERHTAE